MPGSIIEHCIKTKVSGRYLVLRPSSRGPYRLLAGFHGYGELAEDELDLLKVIAGGSGWICCSIEALHPFYTQRGKVGANWMTGRNTGPMIEENVCYADAVITEIAGRYPLDGTLVYHGFSRGTAMAACTALLGSHEAAGVMLLGGNIPPEHGELGKMKRVHIARGNSDRLYTLKEFERDKARLEESGVPFVHFGFPGGHEATESYLKEAGEFLKQVP